MTELLRQNGSGTKAKPDFVAAIGNPDGLPGARGNMSTIKPVHVVCAIIVRKDGRILVAKRPLGKRLGGLWEFPGGKVEPDEDPYSALEREIREELGLKISKKRHLIDVTHAYDWGTIVLSAFLTGIQEGTPTLHEHEAMRWCDLREFQELTWAPADLPIVRLLEKESTS